MRTGLYKAEDEHSSCGCGLVVAISGKPSRKVVENGINALKAVWHRGAVDADGKTGDGAGIHVQIPVRFSMTRCVRTGHEPDTQKLIAVGQVFLPRTDFGAQERCRTIVETEVCGWAITSMAGGMCRWMSVWATRPMRRGPRSSRF
jgi:glutamate synthase (NADPH) large chain